MSASLPSFVPASELPPSLSREEELEAKIREQAIQLERMQDGGAHRESIESREIHKFVEIISVLEGRIKTLELQVAAQSRQISDLKSELSDVHQDVVDIRMLEKDAVQDLKSEVASCMQHQERIAEDIALDRKRISGLEHPHNRYSEVAKIRAAKIGGYMCENATPYRFFDRNSQKFIEARAVRYELLRSYLGIDKWALNRAIHYLNYLAPGEYCSKKLNKTTWLLVELPKL